MTRRSYVTLCASTAVSTALAAAAIAQLGAPRFVKIAPSTPKTVHTGKPFTISVAVTVDSPYHIQGNPSKEGYIATELEVGPAKGFKVDKVVYPKAMETSFSGERLPVYEGKVVMKTEVTADKTTRPGKYVLPITLNYQGCDEQKCFPPTTVSAKATVTVAPGSK
jgi:hypothetical protein